MAARAIWKGVLRIGGEAVPVKLYSAVDAGRTVRFRLLHAPDRTPVQARMVNPATGRSVAHEDTRRGFVTDDGRLVVLDREELDALEPEPSRDVELLRFVPAGSLDPRWYERPYYLGPDGDEASWAGLARALAGRKVEGIARWVMRKHAYVGALRLEHGIPMLVTLRRPGELVDTSRLPRPRGRTTTGPERTMAEQLLRALSGPFRPEEWKDEHRERLLSLVAAKAEGKTIPLAERRPRATEPDLADALRRSLAGARKSA